LQNVAESRAINELSSATAYSGLRERFGSLINCCKK